MTRIRFQGYALSPFGAPPVTASVYQRPAEGGDQGGEGLLEGLLKGLGGVNPEVVARLREDPDGGAEPQATSSA